LKLTKRYFAMMDLPYFAASGNAGSLPTSRASADVAGCGG